MYRDGDCPDIYIIAWPFPFFILYCMGKLIGAGGEIFQISKSCGHIVAKRANARPPPQVVIAACNSPQMGGGDPIATNDSSCALQCNVLGHNAATDSAPPLQVRINVICLR